MAESNEDNNCIASAATVTVTRPDLTENTASAPPATKVRGTTFPVTDTVENFGAVGSAPSSTTRYYLSLDAVKSAGDTLLNGSRGDRSGGRGTHSGTVTLTIPAAAPPNTYFLLACADAPNTVVETDEANNCTASSTTVTVTP